MPSRCFKSIIALWSIAAVAATAWLIGACVARADPLDSLVRPYMAAHRVPGLALAVIESGRLTTERYYGKSNLETGTPVGRDSVFELASLTKPFTATAIMLLVQRGQISLSDPITNYINGAPPAWRAITIRNLLDHTAGFPEQAIVSCHGVPLMDVSTKAQFDLIARHPLLFPPGKRALYSDPGYFLLGMIIEHVSGSTYANFMQRNIFDPAGMAHTSILDQSRILPGRVSPYTIDNGVLKRARRDWQHQLPSFFGIWSTLADVAKFDIALTEGKLVAPSYVRDMWAPAELADGKDVIIRGKFHYGLGWVILPMGKHKVVGHDGFVGTVLLQFPDANLSVIVLSNLDEGSGNIVPDLALQIAAQIQPGSIASGQR